MAADLLSQIRAELDGLERRRMAREDPRTFLNRGNRKPDLLTLLRGELDGLEGQLDELEGVRPRRPALTLIRGGRDA